MALSQDQERLGGEALSLQALHKLQPSLGARHWPSLVLVRDMIDRDSADNAASRVGALVVAGDRR